MCRLFLAQHVHFCEIGDQRAFIDLASDRYFSLAEPANRLFAKVTGAGDLPRCAEAEPLVAAGVLSRSGARPPEPTRHSPPNRSLVEEGLPDRLSPGRMPEALMLVLWARRAMARKRLPRLVGRDSGFGTGDPDRRDQAVRTFLQARRLVPVAANCLYDSLALRRFLARRGIGADLVIGAKLHPFGAHCWLQDGTTVLNDALGTVRVFAPILVS